MPIAANSGSFARHQLLKGLNRQETFLIDGLKINHWAYAPRRFTGQESKSPIMAFVGPSVIAYKLLDQRLGLPNTAKGMLKALSNNQQHR